MLKQMLIERNVPLPMRDGVILRADIYHPETDAPVPAVVVRTPYDKGLPLIPPSGLDPARAAEAGFAVVCQDTRGRYASEGEFYCFLNEGQDGYDTVEWTAAQPWCNGAVGMAGRSYGGVVQWLAAAEQPPHLRAFVPVVTGSDCYRNWIYQGGTFQLGFNLYWALLMLARAESTRPMPYYRHLPLKTLPILRQNEQARFYFDWLDHPTDDAYWEKLAIDGRYGRIEVPAYNVGGWYDMFLLGTLENFVRMRQEGGSEQARAGQRLLIGPWAHGSTYGSFPDHSFALFAPDDAVDLQELQVRYLGHYLRGDANGVEDEPPVRIFVMGENRWRDEQEWPLSRAQGETWFLHSDGSAATAGGSFSREPPDQEPADTYVYDPRDPAPTIGGPTSLPGLFLGTNHGPRDQQRLEERADVLVYTSDPLQQPLEVTGPLSVQLFAASTAVDTDWVAKLTDVAPTGESLILAEGIIRARFREGFVHPRLLEPGAVTAYQIDLVATSNLFQTGHRLRVAITSSSFPRFDRNTNTGHVLGEDGEGEMLVARQTIFHDAQRPSNIVLPVVPR